MHKKENTHILDQHTLAMDLIELQNTCKNKLANSKDALPCGETF